jgi:peptide deformylase
MIYPIFVLGTEVLRAEAKDLPLKKNPEFEQLISDMFETMHASEGIGLAAPQIGKSINLFVIDASALAEDEPSLKDFKKVFINAQILEYSGEEKVLNEGCLSLPGLREDVVRQDTIRIKYYDENFELHEEIFTGFPARIIQHEYDHTQGVVFTDRIAKVKKVLIRNKLKAMSAGRFDASYRTITGEKNKRETLLVRNPAE